MYCNSEFITQGLNISQPLFFDTETIGLYGKTRLIQVRQANFSYVYDCFYLNISEILDCLKNFHIVIHNAHYDLSCTDLRGWLPRKVDCTMAMSRIALPKAKSHSLANLATELKLGASKLKDDHKAWDSMLLSPQQLEYAETDTLLLQKLYTKLKALKADENDLYKLDLANIIAATEYQFAGLPVCKEACKAQIAKLHEEATQSTLIPRDLNVNSSQQVAKFLNIDSSAKGTLMGLNTPLSRAILQKRKKLKEIAYLEDIAKHEQVISIINPIGTTTGRFSASGKGTFYKNALNLQQIPRNVKKVFKHKYFVCADYPALEINLACAIIGDSTLHTLLKSGEDLHLRTAKLMFENNTLTKESPERQIAKTCNFQLLYGSGDANLAEKFIEADKHEFAPKAHEFKQLWLNTFKDIQAWQRMYFEIFQNSKGIIVNTALGRSLYATSATSAMNYSVQGSGAECTKYAIVLLAHKGISIALNVHDSIVLKCANFNEAQEKAQIVADCMSEAFSRVTANCKISDLRLKIDAQVCENLT